MIMSATRETYVCKMMVEAVRMTDRVFNRKHRIACPPGLPAREGYNSDGFDTWFPRRAFEEAHYTRREEVEEASARAKKFLAEAT